MSFVGRLTEINATFCMYFVAGPCLETHAWPDLMPTTKTGIAMLLMDSLRLSEKLMDPLLADPTHNAETEESNSLSCLCNLLSSS